MSAGKFLAEPLSASEQEALRALCRNPREIAAGEKMLEPLNNEGRERVLTFCAAFLQLPPDRRIG
jgi:hypothetical protein